MADSLIVPTEQWEALADGSTITAITGRNAVGLNDEVELVANGDPGKILFALVVAVQPAASISAADGDAVFLRVFVDDESVLSDEEFSARRSDVEAEWK